MYKNIQIKKILFVIDEFHVGGVTSFIRNYALTLIKQGYIVAIIGFSYDLESADSYFKDCKIYKVKGGIEVSPLKLPKVVPRFYTQLNKVYKEFQPNVIHFSSVHSYLFCLLHPRTWQLKKLNTFYGPYFLEDSYEQSVHKPLSLNVKRFLKKYIQKALLNHCEKIITFSNYSKQILVQHFGKNLQKKVVIIPGFVSSALISNKARKTKPSKEFILLNICRAEDRKGLTILLEAISLLQKQKYTIKCYIASPVTYYLGFQNTLMTYQDLNLFKSVHFLHKVDDEQKKVLFQEADLFVMSSLDLETFGLVMVESMYHKVPVVGTPVGAIPEILKKISPNLVAKTATAKGLTERIKWYIHLDTLKKSALIQKCFKTVQKEYLLESNTSKILEAHFMVTPQN